MRSDAPPKVAAPQDPDFAGALEKDITSQRPGRFLAGFWVAVGLYLPFAGIPGRLNNPNDWWFGWALLWPILPGFGPGAFLAHPHDRAIFVVAALTTIGLLAGLTWLGSAGGWRLGFAIALAFLVSIPTAMFVMACIAF